MKQSTKTLLLLGCFVVLLLAAGIGYRALSADYENTQMMASPENPSDSAAEPETQASPEPTPMPAPDFSVETADGETVRLSDFRGKPVVVNFWATWCGPCKSELPAFDRAYAEYGEDVVFLMVNLTDGQRETVDGVAKFVKDGGYDFPVYYDTSYSAANAYGVYSIPMTVLVDAEGNLIGGQVGAVSEGALLMAVGQMQRDNEQ